MAIGIFVALVLARRERLGGGLEQLREAGENIAEQARPPQRDIDAGTAELGRRDDVVADKAAARKCGEQSIALGFAASPAAEHVQAVAELAFLEIADKAIDPGDCFGWYCRRIEAEIVFEARSTRLVANRGDQALATGGIET